MEDAVLIERIIAGDKAALNELVGIYADSILKTCYKFLLNKEDAEDVSQEVFIEVFQSLSSFRGKSKLSSWIYRIAVTKSLDEIKKRKRKKRISTIGKVLHLDEVANWLVGGLMPDKSIHEEEKMNEVMHALNTLPENQRVAFTLSKIEGFNNSEIAAIMATSNIAVESLISRAKKKVSNELEFIIRNQLH